MAVEYINQVELARRFRLSSRTVEGWRRRGVGPQYLKLGGRVLYRLADVTAFETAQVMKTSAARPTTPLRLVRA